MKDFFKKLTSRKFITAVVGIISGLAIIFGLDDGIITTVAGTVTSVASVVAYIVTEGKVDAAAVGDTVAQVIGTVELIGEGEDGENKDGTGI